MKRLIAVLLSVIAVVFASSAHAAVVYDGYPTGPGGLSTPYPAVNPEVYAGLIELNGGTGSLLGMSDDYNNRVNVGDSWVVTYYTYADVMAGAPVKYTAAQYARAAFLLGAYDFTNSGRTVRELAIMYGSDGLAMINTQVWEIMSSTACPSFFSSCSQIDDPNWLGNWSSLMLVAAGRDEYLIPFDFPGQYTLANVPLPPAAWLLGSGLLGLVGVARKRNRGVTPLS